MKSSSSVLLVCVLALVPCVVEGRALREEAGEEAQAHHHPKHKTWFKNDVKPQPRIAVGSPSLPTGVKSEVTWEITIGGTPQFHMVALEMEDVLIPPIEMDEFDENGFQLFCPGTPEYGNVRLSFEHKEADELKTWFTDVAYGKDIRKDITISIFRAGNTELPTREIVLKDAQPIRWDAGNLVPGTATHLDRMTLTISGMKFTARTNPSEVPSSGGGFAVQAVSMDENGKEVMGQMDKGWLSVEGGAIALEQTRRGFLTGKKTIGTITLRGPVTAERTDFYNMLAQNLSPTYSPETQKQLEELDGQIEAATLLLQQLKKKKMARAEETMKAEYRISANGGGGGSTYTYNDCFPVRYVFPKLTNDGVVSGLEEVELKPLRVGVVASK